jgi:ABC-type transport system involved in multi-copper enzyme maturation permease subunit
MMHQNEAYMIVSIALKEFYSNLISSRFLLGFLLSLFLIPFAMVVSIHDYTGQQRAYEMARKQAEESTSVRVYSALRPQIVRPLEPLSIFSSGISGQTGSSVKILLGEKPMLAGGWSAARENPLMNAFFSLDFTSVLVLILSLLALLFTYDACSGEREKGTLRLILTNPLSRSIFLLGKVLGVTLTLLPVLVFCFILSALIIVLDSRVAFGPGEWGRIALLLGMSLLMFLLFAAAGLFISARVRSSITSIVICLFLWVTSVFIVPNGAIYLAQSFSKTDTEENLRFAFNELDREFQQKCSDFQKKLPPPDWMMHWNMNGGGDGFMELAGSSRSMNEFHRLMNAYSEPLRIEYADKKWALQSIYLDKLDRQRKLADHLALLSPSEVFQQAASALCRTDVSSYSFFMDETRRYREQLINFFREKKIFESFAYFTHEDPAKFMTADEIVRIRTGGRFQTLREYTAWAEAQHTWSFAPLRKVDIPGTNPYQYASLDLSDVPQFHGKPPSLAGDVKRSLPGLAGLALGGLLLFFLSFVSFSRYDAR